MMDFSPDPRIAEQEMHALLFCLASFGYVDGSFEGSEKEFIRGHVSKLIEHRARGALDGQDPVTARDVVTRWTQHFHEVLDQIEHQIKTHFTESVNEGETAHQFVMAKLKLRCFELFKSFDEP